MASLNSKGQTVTHHYFWMATILIVVFGIYWIYSSNRPDTYERGAVHVEDKGWALIEIGKGGCARMDSLKGMKNASSVNRNN